MSVKMILEELKRAKTIEAAEDILTKLYRYYLSRDYDFSLKYLSYFMDQEEAEEEY